MVSIIAIITNIKRIYIMNVVIFDNTFGIKNTILNGNLIKFQINLSNL